MDAIGASPDTGAGPVASGAVNSNPAEDAPRIRVTLNLAPGGVNPNPAEDAPHLRVTPNPAPGGVNPNPAEDAPHLHVTPNPAPGGVNPNPPGGPAIDAVDTDVEGGVTVLMDNDSGSDGRAEREVEAAGGVDQAEIESAQAEVDNAFGWQDLRDGGMSLLRGAAASSFFGLLTTWGWESDHVDWSHFSSKFHFLAVLWSPGWN